MRRAAMNGPLRRLLSDRGMSLVELMVAVSILSIGLLAFTGSFQYISKAIYVSRARTLATNLAQEKVENLKNFSYYKLLLTTSFETNNDFSPALVYDDTNYPPEEILIGGITFKRAVLVSFGVENNNVITTVSPNYPDTGLKVLRCYVMWKSGTEWKHVSLDNLYENPNVTPLNTSITGEVDDGGGADVPGAVVQVVENVDWSATGDASGDYTIQVHAGNYSVRASSSGYYPQTITNVNVTTSAAATVNFALTPIGSGTISGIAWFNDHLVISQIVSASNTARGGLGAYVDVEYVELFNPTTFNINIGQGVSKQVKVDYRGENGLGSDASDATFNLQYISTFVAPGHYYLIASTGSFYILGQLHYADATYGTANANHIRQNDAGCFRILRADNTVIDAVAWCDDTGGCQVPAGCAETTPIPDSAVNDGLVTGHQFVRVSSPLLTSNVYGRAYDSGNNVRDFLYASPGGFSGTIAYEPKNTADGFHPVLAGKPAVGAYVAADDLLGPTTQAFTAYVSSLSFQLPYAQFNLKGVSTGTWTVVIASGSYAMGISSVVVTQGAVTPVLNAATDPAQPVAGHAAVHLSSAAAGYVTGSVTNLAGNPLPGIPVLAAGTLKTTAANGRYFAQVSTGPITVIANPANANPAYIESVAQPTVAFGQIVTQNFTLTQGGVLRGHVTTDGNSVLPNVEVSASISGLQYGVGTSDTSGVFYIKNLGTGTYTVAPALDPMESSSPASVVATVTSTGTVDIGTFTITGAMGLLTGKVYNNGELVTSGALILASPAALSVPPTQIVASSSPAQTVIYAASSRADGTYEMDVRGSAAPYYVTAYLPEVNATGATVMTKSYTGVTVTADATTTRDINFP